MTVSVLHLLKNMLNFGMYDTKASLKKLIVVLMNLLHGTCDVSNEEEMTYLESTKE